MVKKKKKEREREEREKARRFRMFCTTKWERCRSIPTITTSRLLLASSMKIASVNNM
jgi:hypothetical protein